MRIFPLYAPRLIAKHAKIFRDGVVRVQEDELGEIEFRDGRFVMPSRCTNKMRSVVRELNKLLSIPKTA
ncbi:DUF1107 family protein [Ferrimonas lipolytica]|uniref:DUF1107 family protein n=1 Tax=Ferrimonas lipolytica TaxID=2724191 RepID=A0A6H1UG58_9GAMM|nr:DUF1107 family protein [Ferrimonas lipolytica]QIZ78087.1 DUF1107 family protein [Ferrimonas lipolytica]